MRRHRCRRNGVYRRSFDISDAQLDRLEVRGYLDPDLRDERADEAEAIETFLQGCAN